MMVNWLRKNNLNYFIYLQCTLQTVLRTIYRRVLFRTLICVYYTLWYRKQNNNKYEGMELSGIQKTDLTPDHKNGIHLWQFLLSLLRQPKFEKHIKWIDQGQGNVNYHILNPKK